MTENKRIIINTLATYGRSLFALLMGLFSARWVLAALGKEDLGLYGVVGSIMFCITFISGMLSGSVSRFYAFSVGEERRIGGEEGRERVTAWFNAALSIYIVLPLVLITIGFPVGLYAIDHWLVIPSDRIMACKIVLGLSMASAFVGMISLPYISMYRAYQLIAELSFWGVLSTILTFIGAYVLLFVGGDRLVVYAALMTGIGVCIASVQMIRARKHFPACQIRRKYLFGGYCIRQLFNYSFWEFFGCAGDLIRGQGAIFLINRHLGAGMNAAYTIGNQVSGHTQSLAAALLGALEPAMSTAAGADEKERAISLAFRSCKFCAMLIIIFCVPLILEIDEVLRLWLKNPPEGAAIICQCILIATICHKLGWGHHILVCSYGKIRGMQFTLGLISALTAVLIWALLKLGWGMFGVGFSFIVSFTLLTVVRVAFARKLLGMSVRHWLLKVVVPIVVLIVASSLVGISVRSLFPPSFWRVCLTSSITLIVAAPLAWWIVLDSVERGYICLCLAKFRERLSNR